MAATSATGREAGIAEARRRFGTNTADDSDQPREPTTLQGRRRNAGLDEARRRFGQPTPEPDADPETAA